MKEETKNLVELKNVCQSYDEGKVQIIKDFNFVIEDVPIVGEFVALLGMSGCGKSTILRYIAGLQQPSSGEVKVLGKPVNEDNRVSMVFQQYSSFPWMSVLDNVALGLRYQGVQKKERNALAMDIIQKVGLDGHQNKFAQTPTLSGGQLQRVAIARSLLSNPKIILMDEPFGALDINTRLQMQDLLIKIWEEYNSTVIFVTHDINEAVYLADEICIMKKAPSNIAKRIKIDLDVKRTREIKRTPRFTELVQYVEEQMIQVGA